MGTDVIVVGGGVIGLSIAWRARLAGLTVKIVDDQREQRASWAAAGMLAPVTELHPGEDALLDLNRRSAERYPSFVAELEAASDLSVGYRRCGTVIVAYDNGDAAVIDEIYRHQQSLGLEAERLVGSACRRLEPALATGVRAGVHVPGDHQVDNRRLLRALAVAAQRCGVEDVAATVLEVTTAGGRVNGVRLEDGSERTADLAVVLAAGCWVAGLGGLDGLQLPVRPLKGQILRLRARGRSLLPGRTVRAIVAGKAVYIAPREDGEIVVGATMEEQGFDTTVTAGAVHDLLHDARAVIPGLDEAELVECRAGLRPATPDNLPILGAAAVVGLDGLVFATGHGRNGILLTPLTAEGIVALLATGELPAYLAGCHPARFVRPGALAAAGAGAGAP